MVRTLLTTTMWSVFKRLELQYAGGLWHKGRHIFPRKKGTKLYKRDIHLLAPSILKGAFKCFAARGNEWVMPKMHWLIPRTISLNTCIDFALIWVVIRSWSVLKDFTWQNIVTVFFLQKWSKSWNPRVIPSFGKERSFKTKMYIICIAWTTYSRWNLFCSILSYFHASHFRWEDPSWFARQNKTQPSDRQCPRSPDGLRNSSSISADCFDQGVPSPMPAAAGCASRPPLQSQSTHLHWNTGCCYVTTWNIRRRKNMVERTSRRICAIFQAGRVNFLTSLREKHALSTCARKWSTRLIQDFFKHIVAICNMNSVFCTSILAQFLYHLSIQLYANFAKKFCLRYSIHCAQLWENLATAMCWGILFNTLDRAL